MTTLFQRAALSIIGHAYLKELTGSETMIRNKRIQVNKKNGGMAFIFKVNELSRFKIDIVEEGGRYFKVWSEKVVASGGKVTGLQLRCEGDSYNRPLELTDINSSYVKGRDADYKEFEIELESWWKMKIWAFSETDKRIQFTYYLLG